MVVNNFKYTTYRNVLSRLHGLFPKKMSAFNREDDIIEWCAQTELEILGDPYALRKYEKIQLGNHNQVADTYTINNLEVLLPANLHKLLAVYKEDFVKVRYESSPDGYHLNFSTYDEPRECYIDYYGVAVEDDTGFPLIKKGNEDACLWNCAKNLFLEDYMNGELDATRWGEIIRNLDNEIKAAESDLSHFTDNELEQLQKIRYNITPRIGVLPKYNIH